ncbi:hypothetical protein QJS04_geneDACA002604 [Acorus gramineus]|uniref:Uncharacterized protein n=1 Tax=Acorus gramineus TaxID=55184 RepID=A0AAV9ASL5_ACOGR|nr:hypothetical protein QJS04_geneDACA002604 [Acorus gramineus]
MVDLAGKDGIVSKSSPGVFLQVNIGFLYSLEHSIPLVAFSQDRCLTLYDHPVIDSLHTVSHEPKSELLLLAIANNIFLASQKLLFYHTMEGINTTLRPYWSEAIKKRAGIVQTQPENLEIVPPGTSTGNRVMMLLDHLGITTKEIMAIGDGENDVEMLQLASLGVGLSNGSEKAKAMANVIGASNDEDGVAEAIYEYVF